MYISIKIILSFKKYVLYFIPTYLLLTTLRLHNKTNKSQNVCCEDVIYIISYS